MTAQNGVNTTALTRPAMAVFGRSAVVSPAFKKQFYKELQTPFLIENNNDVECRRGYKYENSQHLEISRIYVNGKCPYP